MSWEGGLTRQGGREWRRGDHWKQRLSKWVNRKAQGSQNRTARLGQAALQDSSYTVPL